MITEEALEQLKYPIGRYVKPDTIHTILIEKWILDIESLPRSIEELVNDLSVLELNYPYRPNGWNIKQVVHHFADSHMNAFIRFKLALTEDSPIIKPYYEDRWATLDDGKSDDISDSLNLLISLHVKWSRLLQQLNTENLKRSYIHPEHGKRFQLDEAIGLYAWHCNHHLAHIRQALEYKGTF